MPSTVIGLSSYGHLVQQESHSINLYQLGRYDSKVASTYSASSGLNARSVTGSSSSAAVDHGVSVFTIGATDLHVMDAATSELLWSAALPSALNASAVDALEVVICSPQFLVLWSSKCASQCWTAMSPKAAARIAKMQQQDEGEESDDEGQPQPGFQVKAANPLAATTVLATECMATCVAVPMPTRKGGPVSVEAVLPVEEQDEDDEEQAGPKRVSFTVVTGSMEHHSFTQENLAQADVVFIQSGAVTGGVKSLAGLARRSNFFMAVVPEEFSATTALFEQVKGGGCSVLTATVSGDSIAVTLAPVTGLEAGSSVSWGTAINGQCWVIVGSTAAVASKKASTGATSWIASLAVDVEGGSAVATSFPLVDSIQTCTYDSSCDGVRLVRIVEGGHIETTVVPFPEREDIVLDTVELLLQGVGLEENAWNSLSTSSQQDEPTRTGAGFNAKEELLFHYLVPTASSNALSVLAVSAPISQHNRRATNGKSQLVHLVACEDSSNSVFQYTWHPNAVRYALRMAGSDRCLKLLRVVTEGLRGNSNSVLSPLQLRTVGMSLAMHIVTLSRPLGLQIPAKDVETLYQANSQSRGLGPNMVSAATRLDALTAFAAQQEANETSVFGSIYSTPASLQLKKYAYGNNAAALIAALKSKLPANLQKSPEALVQAGAGGIGQVEVGGSPFAQYEAGAVAAGAK